jgi:hypothetical protein
MLLGFEIEVVTREDMMEQGSEPRPPLVLMHCVGVLVRLALGLLNGHLGMRQAFVP